jgi:hypothetical protein
MSTAAPKKFCPECLSASWLAERFGVDPAKIDLMRRSGDLLAVHEEGSTEWLYPAWQLDGLEPRRVIPRIAAAAREAGLDEAQLYRVLTGPLGLRGESRLVDLLLEGRDDDVVAAVRTARPS